MFVKQLTRPVIANCLIQNGLATSRGGGIYSVGSPYFVNCTIRYNQAALDGVGGAHGGGGYLNGGVAQFVNTVFYNNTADAGAAAVYCDYDADKGNLAIFKNCTLARNNAGGASANGSCVDVECGFSVQAWNSIWWENYYSSLSPSNLTQRTEINFQGYDYANGKDDCSNRLIDIRYCDIHSGGTSSGDLDPPLNDPDNIYANPYFENVGSGDLRLRYGIYGMTFYLSPCIDAGNNLMIPTVDIADLDYSGLPAGQKQQLPLDRNLADRISCPDTTVEWARTNARWSATRA